jgi:hypothetical protein
VVSGVKGSIAIGTELYTETLTTPSLDEVSTEYGLLAKQSAIRPTIRQSPIACARRHAGMTANQSHSTTFFFHSTY